MTEGKCAHCNSSQISPITSKITDNRIVYIYKCNVCHKHSEDRYKLTYVETIALEN